MTDNRSVIVIGGGLAGCSAALALARAGRSVQLVESRSRLGGRVGSTTDSVTGQTIDYCQHVGMACCSSLLQLIESLDQCHLWHRQRELYFYAASGERQTLRALPLLPAPAHLAGWLLRWPGLTLLDRLSIARAMLALNRVPVPDPPLVPPSLRRSANPLPPHMLALDQQSALEWLQAHRQSPIALRKFWSTIAVSALGEELSRVGLLALAKVFQDGFLRRRAAFHLLIPQRPLDDLLGMRFQTKLIAAGVEVLTKASVASLNWAGSHCTSVILSDGRCLNAERFVMAVPWHGVQRLVADCPDAAVRSIGAQADQLQGSPISGVHTWWDRPWLPTSHAVLVDGLCQWVFPHSHPEAVSDDSRQAYYQIVISASRLLPRGDNEAIKRLIADDLEKVFPEVRQARLLRVKAVTDRQAVFSVAAGTSRLRPAMGSHDANLYWAGDWVLSGWPATMEGAIRSGFAAAAAITESR